MLILRVLLALDHPFLLLPFRPTSDPSAVRTFIRHFFEAHQNLRGEQLLQELRMTEPMVRRPQQPRNVILTRSTGRFRRRKVVLESSSGRHCWLGCL